MGVVAIVKSKGSAYLADKERRSLRARFKGSFITTPSILAILLSRVR